MRNIVQIITLSILFFISNTSFSQEKISNLIDGQLKESLYSKYKKEVQSYDKKQFDTLFFDFFSKQNDKTILLSKEEYYTYTVKIAIYSEKLGLLYKDQKEESLKAKEDWLEKNYKDYLDTKKK